jgi:hypothetical protein
MAIVIRVPDSQAMRKVLLSLAEHADSEADYFDAQDWDEGSDMAERVSRAYTAFGVAVNDALGACPVHLGLVSAVRDGSEPCHACREEAVVAIASFDTEGEAHYRDEDLELALVSMAEDYRDGKR